MGTNQASGKEKRKKILEVLREPIVIQMFERLDLWTLPISPKLKLLTTLYKKRIGISMLLLYSRKTR